MSYSVLNQVDPILHTKMSNLKRYNNFKRLTTTINLDLDHNFTFSYPTIGYDTKGALKKVVKLLNNPDVNNERIIISYLDLFYDSDISKQATQPWLAMNTTFNEDGDICLELTQGMNTHVFGSKILVPLHQNVSKILNAITLIIIKLDDYDRTFRHKLVLVPDTNQIRYIYLNDQSMYDSYIIYIGPDQIDREYESTLMLMNRWVHDPKLKEPFKLPGMCRVFSRNNYSYSTEYIYSIAKVSDQPPMIKIDTLEFYKSKDILFTDFEHLVNKIYKRWWKMS